MTILNSFSRHMRILTCQNVNYFHTSVACNDKIWRVRNNKPKHKLQFGPLTDLPDYSYLDGRPTPLGSHQLSRSKKQEELAVKMVSLLSEIDFAVDRHRNIQEEKADKRDRVIKGRLVEKGKKLVDAKHN